MARLDHRPAGARAHAPRGRSRPLLLVAACALCAAAGYIAGLAGLPTLRPGGTLESSGSSPGAAAGGPDAQARRLHSAPAAPAPKLPLPAGGSPSGGGDAFARRCLAATGLGRARPPLAPGASGEPRYRVQPYQILSWHPRIVLLPGFLDAAACDRIIRVAEAAGLSKTPVIGEPGADDQGARTSTGVFLASSADPNGDLAALEEKIAAATLLPASHGEPFNILRYGPGQTFEAHMDAFDPEGLFKANNQRLATVITYLSDVEEGGETVFHCEGAGTALAACTVAPTCGGNSSSSSGSGLKVAPRKGDALLFYSLTPDLSVDFRSLHSSCPVKRGVKWAATKWIFQKPFVLKPQNATAVDGAGAAGAEAAGSRSGGGGGGPGGGGLSGAGFDALAAE